MDHACNQHFFDGGTNARRNIYVREFVAGQEPPAPTPCRQSRFHMGLTMIMTRPYLGQVFRHSPIKVNRGQHIPGAPSTINVLAHGYPMDSRDTTRQDNAVI